MENRYDKMDEYILSMYNVVKLVNKNTLHSRSERMKYITLIIFNYVKFMAKEHNVDLKKVVESTTINLIPVFEYITANNIELYDFNTIDTCDLDVTKRDDLERFVLTHVYYITQKNTPQL